MPTFDSEPDAVAVYFDLAQGETFDSERHAVEFRSPPMQSFN